MMSTEVYERLDRLHREVAYEYHKKTPNYTSIAMAKVEIEILTNKMKKDKQ